MFANKFLLLFVVFSLVQILIALSFVAAILTIVMFVAMALWYSEITKLKTEE